MRRLREVKRRGLAPRVSVLIIAKMVVFYNNFTGIVGKTTIR
jgi:hypothetical protein